jgi:hypothetical protein
MGLEWRAGEGNPEYQRNVGRVFAALADDGGYGLGVKAFYGDLNCDGMVNFDDIDPFVALLSGGREKELRVARSE